MGDKIKNIFENIENKGLSNYLFTDEELKKLAFDLVDAKFLDYDFYLDTSYNFDGDFYEATIFTPQDKFEHFFYGCSFYLANHLNKEYESREISLKHMSNQITSSSKVNKGKDFLELKVGSFLNSIQINHDNNEIEIYNNNPNSPEKYKAFIQKTNSSDIIKYIYEGE